MGPRMNPPKHPTRVQKRPSWGANSSWTLSKQMFRWRMFSTHLQTGLKCKNSANLPQLTKYKYIVLIKSAVLILIKSSQTSIVPRLLCWYPLGWGWTSCSVLPAGKRRWGWCLDISTSLQIHTQTKRRGYKPIINTFRVPALDQGPMCWMWDSNQWRLYHWSSIQEVHRILPGVFITRWVHMKICIMHWSLLSPVSVLHIKLWGPKNWALLFVNK